MNLSSLRGIRFRDLLPTFFAYWEKRKRIRQNRLPKHLRPPSIWPIWVQLAFNSVLVLTLWNLMIDRDDYLSEAGPAIVMVICFLVIIYTLITAVRLRRRFAQIRGRRLSKINLALMLVAFLSWVASVVVYLP